MTKQVFTILKKLGKDTNANSFLLKMVPCSQSISNKTTMYFLLIFQDDTCFKWGIKLFMPHILLSGSFRRSVTKLL